MIENEVQQAKKRTGTFHRTGPKQKDRTKWVHSRHKGWVKLRRGVAGLVMAEIRTLKKDGEDWRLLRAFMGYLDRLFGNHIVAINIQYVN
jgi:hypothetical protein